MNQVQIEQIFQRLNSVNPDPKTELEFNNIFTLTVAVILSAQATDISVNKATKLLFQNYDTPEKMVSLGESGLKEYIKSIGLFNSKAKNIISLCQILIDQHSSQVPGNFDQLIKLPGIGRKTANVVLNCGFGKKTMAVDTHVFRVSNRTGLANANTPEKVEKILMKKIPEKWLFSAHHLLILHGRYICTARRPKCTQCIISDLCKFKEKNSNE